MPCRMLTILVVILITPFLSVNVQAKETAPDDFLNKLTQEERNWLASHSDIRVGFMKNWHPISFLNTKNKPQGISLEYAQTIDKMLGDSFHYIPGEWDHLLTDLKHKKIDLLLDLTKRPSRESFALFTEPYLKIPHIIIARKKTPFIENEKQLSGKVLALEKGFGNVEYFQNKFPEVLIHEYPNTLKALEAVAIGQADAYAGNRAVAIHLINQNVITNLKIHGVLNKPGSILSVGVRKDWPLLQSILQKALDSISLQEKQDIQDKWVKLNILDAYQFKEYRTYIILALLLIIALLAWTFYLKRKVGYFKKLIYHQANFDPLTGLANRYLFQDRLEMAFEQAQKEENAVLVFVCRLNELDKIKKIEGLKTVNQLLQQTAKLLSDSKEIDSVARWSENAFAFFITGLDNQTKIDSLSNNLIKKLTSEKRQFAPFFSISLSFGGAIYPKDGSNSEEVLLNMSLALDEASKPGSEGFSFFDSKMNEIIKRRLQLDLAIAVSLQNNEFQVYFQPKINTKTQSVHSFEALIRWFHPKLGQVSPAEFIPTAEASGQIIELGKFVFIEAIKEAKRWQNLSDRDICIAINLSPMQFKEEGLIDFIEDQLNQYQLPARLIEIEITEGVLLNETAEVIGVITRLKNLGCKLSMDDFGTGYSSLSYLRRYPFDILKIDKEFIENMMDDPHNQQLIISMIALAKALNLQVVAEGVETKNQLEFLQTHNCDIIQGFYFSPAIPKEQALRLVESSQELVANKL